MEPARTSPELVIGEIRPEDLPCVAIVHRRAFPGSALTVLGNEAVRRYYEWQLLGPHDVVVRGAFRDGQLVGFCFGGIFRGALAGFMRKNRAYILGRLVLCPWLVLTPEVRGRLGAGLRALRAGWKAGGPPAAASTGPARRPFGILAIATDPAYARRGVGGRLMAELAREAQARGFAAMMLTVHPTNRAAVEFYEKLGWVRVPVAGLWLGRMAKTLPPADAAAASR
jgi:ribosomal protein S18 acetylase RimI-like enzyme